MPVVATTPVVETKVPEVNGSKKPATREEKLAALKNARQKQKQNAPEADGKKQKIDANAVPAGADGKKQKIDANALPAGSDGQKQSPETVKPLEPVVTEEKTATAVTDVPGKVDAQTTVVPDKVPGVSNSTTTGTQSAPGGVNESKKAGTTNNATSVKKKNRRRNKTRK